MNKQGYWLTLVLASCAVPGLYGQAFVNGSRTQHGPTNYCADAGDSDAYACALSPAISSYSVGNSYRFKANTANTGASTINFNSLGAKTIKKAIGGVTTDLADNDIRAGQFVDVVYDGTNMQMQSVLGVAAIVVVASGIATLGTDEIASAACAAVVTVAATGVATTDVVTSGFNGDPTAVIGYVPATAGMLTIVSFPSADNVNFKVCNNTVAAVTPGAITLNWRVVR